MTIRRLRVRAPAKSADAQRAKAELNTLQTEAFPTTEGDKKNQ
jgi:hypothetical protein